MVLRQAHLAGDALAQREGERQRDQRRPRVPRLRRQARRSRARARGDQHLRLPALGRLERGRQHPLVPGPDHEPAGGAAARAGRPPARGPPARARPRPAPVRGGELVRQLRARRRAGRDPRRPASAARAAHPDRRDPDRQPVRRGPADLLRPAPHRPAHHPERRLPRRRIGPRRPRAPPGRAGPRRREPRRAGVQPRRLLRARRDPAPDRAPRHVQLRARVRDEGVPAVRPDGEPDRALRSLDPNIDRRGKVTAVEYSLVNRINAKTTAGPDREPAAGRWPG